LAAALTRKVGGAKMKSAAALGGACGLVLSQAISIISLLIYKNMQAELGNTL